MARFRPSAKRARSLLMAQPVDGRCSAQDAGEYSLGKEMSPRGSGSSAEASAGAPHSCRRRGAASLFLVTFRAARTDVRLRREQVSGVQDGVLLHGVSPLLFRLFKPCPAPLIRAQARCRIDHGRSTNLALAGACIRIDQSLQSTWGAGRCSLLPRREKAPAEAAASAGAILRLFGHCVPLTCR